MSNTAETQATTKNGTEALAGAMMALNPMATAVWSEVMKESARFVTERLKKDLETQKDLLACRTPADLMRLQSEFYRNAVEQYTAEANRMFAMMAKASGSSRRYDDIPL